MKISIFPASAAFFVCALVSACNPPAVVESKWTDSEIAVSADTMQWKGVIQYPIDPQFGIGVRNDASYLYLCMKSWSHDVNRQILHSGFTAWFTAGPSKKGKRFGIHFPMGMPGNAAARGEDKERMDDPEARKARLLESLQEMELLGPGKDDSVPVKTRVAESFGIGVGIFPSEEYLVYEMKVPLHQDSVCKYAIDIGNDSLLKAAFETTVRKGEAHGQGEGGGDIPGMGGRGGGKGTHGGGGGGRGTYGGGSGGGGRARPSSEETGEQFKASFSIKLECKPAR